MNSEELLLELYNRTLAGAAANFAIDVTDTLLVHLPPPQDIIVLNIVNRSAVYPNIYASMLVPTLQSKMYNPSLYPVETGENGTGLKEFPPEDLVRGKPVIYVDVHFSPRIGLYLPFAAEQNVSRALYAAPIPPPSSLWEYADGRMVRLTKESV